MIRLVKPELSELGVAAAKGLVGGIPFVGTFASELLGTVLPNLRLERLETLLNELSRQVGTQGEQLLQSRLTDPEFVDLVEEGMRQAVRATGTERITQIAAVIKNSLNDEEFRYLQDKRILELLSQINDAEVIKLQSYTSKMMRDDEFHERHASVLNSPSCGFGSPQTEIDQQTLHRQFLSHLTQLNLLKRSKDGYYEIEELGRLLLRRIDLLGENEF